MVNKILVTRKPITHLMIINFFIITSSFCHAVDYAFPFCPLLVSCIKLFKLWVKMAFFHQTGLSQQRSRRISQPWLLCCRFCLQRGGWVVWGNKHVVTILSVSFTLAFTVISAVSPSLPLRFLVFSKRKTHLHMCLSQFSTNDLFTSVCIF